MNRILLTKPTHDCHDRGVRYLAKRFRADVKRLYIYNYYGTDCSTRFDAGLVAANGTPRPAYNVVAQNLPRFRR